VGSIHKELVVNVGAERAWAAIRDIGAVHTRLASGFVVNTVVEGATRLVTFANGVTVRELIVNLDDNARRIAYAVTEWQTTHHNASFQVFPVDDTRCRVVWITDFLPDDLSGLIGQMIEQGSVAIATTLANAR
jgi:hypothetical protein